MKLITNLKVLIVDDQESMRKFVMKELKALGVPLIFSAQNGIEALSILDEYFQKKDEIDLVISDWMMPQMNGVDFFKALRNDQRFKLLPFVMFSSENELTKVLSALDSGVSFYVTKQFDSKIFQEKIKTIIFEISHKQLFNIHKE